MQDAEKEMLMNLLEQLISEMDEEAVMDPEAEPEVESVEVMVPEGAPEESKDAAMKMADEMLSDDSEEELDQFGLPKKRKGEEDAE